MTDAPVLTKVELTNSDGFPRSYNVASGVAIAKGALLSLAPGRVASFAHVSDLPGAGVALMKKDADDFSTTITCITDAIYKAVSSGAITAGEPIGIDAAGNHIHASPPIGTGAPASGAIVIGYALGTTADGETGQFRIRT